MSESTIEAPENMLKRLILIRRNDAINYIQKFKERKARGSTPQEFKLRSSVFTLFVEIKETIKRKWPAERYLLISQYHDSEDIDEVIDCFYMMNEFLDGLGLLKLDSGM